MYVLRKYDSGTINGMYVCMHVCVYGMVWYGMVRYMYV